MHLDILKLVTPKFLACLFFFFFKNNKRMKALRYSKEEDSLTGIISNSFSGGGLLLGQGGVGSKGL